MCVFCKIIQGQQPASVVLDDAKTIAFLDHSPLFKGHVLLMPKEHLETLPDVDPELLAPLFENAQRLCRAVQLAMKSEGTFVAMNNKVSQSVPHLHVHVVPRKKGDGLKGFFWPRTKYASRREMDEIAAAIAAALRVS